MCFLFGVFFFLATRHVGSQLPNQGLNSCPRNWKHRVSTTGLPGKSWRGTQNAPGVERWVPRAEGRGPRGQNGGSGGTVFKKQVATPLLFRLQAPGWQHLLHLSRSLEVSLVVRSKQRAVNVRAARGAFPAWGLSGACSQVSGCGFSL